MALFAQQTHAAAPTWVMGLFVAVMLLAYVGVAYQGLHKTVAALLVGNAVSAWGFLFHLFFPSIAQVYSVGADPFTRWQTGPARTRPVSAAAEPRFLVDAATGGLRNPSGRSACG